MGYVFKLAHFSLGDRKDISIAQVIIIIKSELSTLPIIIIFSVVVCLRCLLQHILSLIAYTFRENRDFVLIFIAQFMMNANSWIRFGLQIVFVFLYITPSHFLTRLAVNTRWWEFDIHGCYSLLKIAFAPISTCKNNRRILRHNASTPRSCDVTDQTVVTSQCQVRKDRL